MVPGLRGVRRLASRSRVRLRALGARSAVRRLSHRGRGAAGARLHRHARYRRGRRGLADALGGGARLGAARAPGAVRRGPGRHGAGAGRAREPGGASSAGSKRCTPSGPTIGCNTSPSSRRTLETEQCSSAAASARVSSAEPGDALSTSYPREILRCPASLAATRSIVTWGVTGGKDKHR